MCKLPSPFSNASDLPQPETLKPQICLIIRNPWDFRSSQKNNRSGRSRVGPMSAGVCGKRPGLEEICGGSSPLGSSAKKLRFSGFNSPIRSPDFAFGFEEQVSILHRMFSSMDRQLVETVLKSRNHKIDDAIESLHALCLGDVLLKNEVASLNSMVNPDGHAGLAGENIQQFNQNVEELQNDESNLESRVPTNGSAWVDTFVQEMMHASNLDDARVRATRILEVFESSVITHSRVTEAQEITSLKEQVQILLRDHQILKRAVAIQHERNLEQEEKLREVQQLKHAISQYQEKIRTLELNNYTLKLHLQRAQWASSIPGHFHPDVI